MKQIISTFLLLLLITGCNKQNNNNINAIPESLNAEEDSIYFYWEKDKRTEEEWKEWEDSINSIATQVKELVKKGIINEQ